MSIAEFNNTINSLLNPAISNVYVNGFLKIFLVLYGSLAAPEIPSKAAPLFSNTIFRLTVMSLIVWSYNNDPALSILVAVVYFVSMHYLSKKLTKEAFSTGVVTTDTAAFFSGGSGPGIKTEREMRLDATKLQSVVNSKIPQAPIQRPKQKDFNIMKSVEQFVPMVPQAIMSEDIHNLARAPNSTPTPPPISK